MDYMANCKNKVSLADYFDKIDAKASKKPQKVYKH